MHEAVARSEFNELAKRLHHLSSTMNIPGFYKTLIKINSKKLFFIIQFY